MIDPDLKSELDNINLHLIEIRKKSGGGVWRSFFSGVMGALGYVVGIAIVVVILGWILQKTGLMDSFKAQVKTFNDLMNEAKKFSAPANNSQTAKPQSSGGGYTTVTLPDGRQVKVNIQQ